jgi:hypothetical protein
MSLMMTSSASPEWRIVSAYSFWSVVEVRLAQEFGHRDHAVHRRADLVAHVGEEGRFGLTGGKCGVARAFAAAFAPDRGRDVDAQAHRVPLRRALVDQAHETAVPQADIDLRNAVAFPALEHRLKPLVRFGALDVDDPLVDATRRIAS